MFLGALDYEPMKINRSLSTGCGKCQRTSRHMISLLCIAKIKLLLQEDATEPAVSQIYTGYCITEQHWYVEGCFSHSLSIPVLENECNCIVK